MQQKGPGDELAQGIHKRSALQKYPGKKVGCRVTDSGNALHAMVQHVEQAAGSGNIWSGIPAPEVITGDDG